jgi:hypothetical protein
LDIWSDSYFSHEIKSAIELTSDSLPKNYYVLISLLVSIKNIGYILEEIQRSFDLNSW